MDNTTNAQQVMGPGVPRAKVSTFNGLQGNFPNWQTQLSRSFVSTQMNTMNPNCIAAFEDLLKQVKHLEGKTESFTTKSAHTRASEAEQKEHLQDIASLALKKTQVITWQKEDCKFSSIKSVVEYG